MSDSSVTAEGQPGCCYTDLGKGCGEPGYSTSKEGREKESDLRDTTSVYMTELSDQAAKYHSTFQTGWAVAVSTSRNHEKRHMVRKANAREI